MKTIAFQNLFRYINRINRKDIFVLIQETRKPFINNYGEIPGYINAADGDPWDIIVPGYKQLETGKPIKLKKLIGVYTIPNGNHKLIVDVHTNSIRDNELFKKEVNRFRKRYEKHNKLRGSVIYF
tara:strand:- start:10177 stop:10551 length:375 start_codon:yes stop_codon:yes gene_type:complete